MVKITKTKTKKKFGIFHFRFFMYAGAPKIAQELFFWSYHLRVCSSYWRKYFAVEKHWYVPLYSNAAPYHTVFHSVSRIKPLLKAIASVANRYGKIPYWASSTGRIFYRIAQLGTLAWQFLRSLGNTLYLEGYNTQFIF